MASSTSIDVLEALLQFKEGGKRTIYRPSHHEVPVPNPLDPTQPHLIEGDVLPSSSVQSYSSFGSGKKSAFKQCTVSQPMITNVPNPLATPVADKYPTEQPMVSSAVNVLTSLSTTTQDKPPTPHGFAVTPMAAPSSTSSSHASPPSLSLDVADVNANKIRDALNSKPQRGKKRCNLSELERVELTRTRNREHAKSTRMKKKARLQELTQIETKYFLLKEKEALSLHRKQHLVDFVENASTRSTACNYSSRLNKLASQVLENPEFCVTDTVALTSEHSGMVKVSARSAGTELGSGNTISGVISVNFIPGTCDINNVSLYWSSVPESTSAFPPSVSMVSFES